MNQEVRLNEQTVTQEENEKEEANQNVNNEGERNGRKNKGTSRSSWK